MEDVKQGAQAPQVTAAGPPGGQTPRGRKKRRTLLIVLIVLLLAVIVTLILRLAGVFYFPWEQRPIVPVVAGDLFPEYSDALDGLPPDLTEEEILERMQQVADESYFRLRIESRPVFPDGGSEGSILIENPDYNSYPIRVQIWMNDTGEIIYDSGGIMPGQYVGNTKLAKVLSKGEYECTADVFQYDPDTLQAVGKTQAALVITIEN